MERTVGKAGAVALWVLLLQAAYCGAAIAQTLCVDVVVRADSIAHIVAREAAPPLALMGRLDTMTASIARRTRIRSPGGPITLALTTAGLDVDVRSEMDRFRESGGSALLLAAALAQVMRGAETGFSTDQADIAALMYRWLALPARSTLTNLGASAVGADVKRRSLLAIAVSDTSSEVAIAIASTLCILDARERALARLNGTSASTGRIALDYMSQELLGAVLNAFGDTVPHGARPYQVSLRSFLDPDGAVGRFVRTAMPSFW